MLSFLIGLGILVLPPQAASPDFYIDRVEVHSDYGSIYILRLANQLIPPDKLSTQRDIDCFVKELKKSGMFGKIRMRTIRARTGKTRRLVVMATTNPKLNRIRLREVVLAGFPEIDSRRFLLALAVNGVKSGQLLVKYSLNELMERITKALRKVHDTRDMEIPWITIEPDGNEKVRLLVLPGYRGCGAGTG